MNEKENNTQNNTFPDSEVMKVADKLMDSFDESFKELAK